MTGTVDITRDVNDEGIEDDEDMIVDRSVDDIEDEFDNVEAKHQALPEEMLGCNTPRKRKEKAACWSSIKRLRMIDDNPPHTANWGKKGYTHVCVHPIDPDEFGGAFCNYPLKLHQQGKGKDRAGQTWVTTHATRHLSIMHPLHDVAEEVN